MRPALLLLALVLGILFLYVHLGVLVIAFHRLGLTPGQAATLVFTALAGSLVNLPVGRIRGIPPEEVHYPPEVAERMRDMPPYRGETVIAINAGGCLVPLAFSGYLIAHAPVPPGGLLLAVAAVTATGYALARPMPGIGIGMPVLVAPVAAALAGIVFGGEEPAVTAYVAGTTGVLLGADLLHLGAIRRIGAPVASIGGAGTFDGIFFTGIVAALLA